LKIWQILSKEISKINQIYTRIFFVKKKVEFQEEKKEKTPELQDTPN